METENRIERRIGLVILAALAIGCALVLRPFFTAVCFALILVVATWPAFEVRKSVRRLKIAMASACPYQTEYAS
jgi:predicted PurR-regulated permease PerM